MKLRIVYRMKIEPIDTISDWQYEGVRGYDKTEDIEKKIEILAEKLNEVIQVVNNMNHGTDIR